MLEDKKNSEQIVNVSKEVKETEDNDIERSLKYDLIVA